MAWPAHRHANQNRRKELSESSQSGDSENEEREKGNGVNQNMICFHNETGSRNYSDDIEEDWPGPKLRRQFRSNMHLDVWSLDDEPNPYEQRGLQRRGMPT